MAASVEATGICERISWVVVERSSLEFHPTPTGILLGCAGTHSTSRFKLNPALQQKVTAPELCPTEQSAELRNQLLLFSRWNLGK